MERVVLVDGIRTPFVKAGGVFGKYSALDLATRVTKALAERTAAKSGVIDELVFSSVLLDPRLPNLAREIVFKAGLPLTTPAHFVSNNCISGLVAASHIAGGISSGRITTGIAGGVESMSRPALALRPSAEAFFLKLARARTLGQRLSILSTFRPRFCLPIPPSPKEPSTGLTMGEHCELMAKEFSIARAAQDALALASHQNAARAIAAGDFANQIISVGDVAQDNLVRGDTSLDKLSGLKPVFDRSPAGTITAGNASALTDGAAAVLLMGEKTARERGLKPLAYVDAIEFAALPPDAGLLMAPAFALPQLLKKAGLSIEQIDLFEVHEAFSAQVLCNMEVWEKGWKRFPELKPIGKIPAVRLNVNGGSVALGHPFAATGGRLLTALAHDLQKKNMQRGVLSICAAGGMAGAALLSRA